jgi:transcriptional regulator with PAS, ATPase and Fis domain
MNREDLTEQDSDRSEPFELSGTARAYLLVMSREGNQVVEVPEHGEASIGRGEGVSVRLDDSRVSRNHARIAWENGQLVVEDLGSRNATLVNGEALSQKKRAVRGGDSIRIAGYEIRVALTAAAPTGDRAQSSDDDDADSDGVVVADESMARVFGFARRVARAPATVLILGETGVGKEVVAGRIHAWSQRRERRFVRVNCAALPETLVESELFGHERGAFTGADRRKIGFAEAAHEGTLFLDEIGELQLPVQAKLLSMLENRSVVRVGNTVETPVDVRVIAATHRSLTKDIEVGRFREDLYYRIGVVVIRVPALRERPSEIALLAQLFATRFGQASGFADPTIAPDANAALLKHSWPGNVRELRNAIEHAFLLSEDGVIRRMHLPETVLAVPAAPSADGPLSQPPPPPDSSPASAGASGGVRAAMAEVERSAIAEALRVAKNNRTQAALALGISLRSLLYKIDKYGLKQG